MGRPKKQRGGEGELPPKTIGFRVSGAYGAWIERLARKHRTTIAGLIDRAVAEWAAAQNHDEPPPDRNP